MDVRERDMENDGNDATEGSEFERLFTESLKTFEKGAIVKGTVLQVQAGAVLLDLGFKSDGIIPAEQFTEDELQSLAPGDELSVLVEEAEDSFGNLRLSRQKAKNMQAWDALSRAYQEGTPVAGTVLAKVKGGLSVDIGVEAFLPGSQVDLKPPHNLDQFIGKTLDVKIIKLNSGRGNVVLSRRALLEKEHAAKKEETLARLTEGAWVNGLVKNITEYGAFVDLGGIDGLLHITDMSWSRINHPSALLKVGERVDVVVLKFDREKEKVSLGLKQKTEDPWLSVVERYPVGSRESGKVVSLTDYGAFIELQHGVEGLVHVSEMSWTQKVKHPSKIMSLGDTVEAQVLSVDAAAKRIALGIKQTQPNPWHTLAERHPVGSEVEGKVKTITDFGAFVGIEEGIDGLVHVSDLSWTKHIKHPSEVLKKGQKTQAKILTIDPEKERISLGLKQLTPDPWEQLLLDRYKVGQDETVTITKKADFGVFVALEHDVEGLIPTSEIPKDAAELAEGGQVVARVIKVDKNDRKIALSIKAQVKGQDRSSLKDYMSRQEKPDTTIGSLLKERS